MVVESDPLISDLIGRQALQPMGYVVQVISDASSAIPQINQFSPNLLIVDLSLPGLSGKDFLVALNSQGTPIPVIVLARKNMEGDIIQAFRLGATDYLVWPVKDAEVVTVVERNIKLVRERRERDRLALKLQQTTKELQTRLRELTILFTVGKTVTSVTDQRTLFDKIVEGATRVTQSDLGWFLLRDDSTKSYVLVAHQNLPGSVIGRLNQTWDDGISSLVATSGEPLSISGDPLKRFMIANLGQAALIVPIKAQNRTIGLLVVMRKIAKSYTQSEQNLLEAVSDYATISLINARLFKALEERVKAAQISAVSAGLNEKIQNGLLTTAKQELQQPLVDAEIIIEQMLGGQIGPLTQDQQQALITVRESLKKGCKIVESLEPVQQANKQNGGSTNLNEAASHVINQLKPLADQNGITIIAQLSKEKIIVAAGSSHIIQAIHGLLARAVRVSQDNTQVMVQVDREKGAPHIAIRDSSSGVNEAGLQHFFDKDFRQVKEPDRHPAILGIDPCTVKEIVTAYDGKIWVESKPGNGTEVHLILKPLQSK